MADAVGNFYQIIQFNGFNNMATTLGPVLPNKQIFLRRANGDMVNLGPLFGAAARSLAHQGRVIDINGILLGDFGTPQIDNNLFIYDYPPINVPPASAPRAGPAGGRSRRSRKNRARKRARRSRKC